ncbi:MAG: hypothetical protein KIT22_12625 [Verrucomicrobiae bacterium]|nr:hypothetical protein [Verrucomicrobiae bacterium]
MGLLLIAGLFTASSWGVLVTFLRLRRMRAGPMWWFAFASLVGVGVTAGGWLLRFEYTVSPRMRFAGFPLPLAFFHLEDGHGLISFPRRMWSIRAWPQMSWRWSRCP